MRASIILGSPANRFQPIFFPEDQTSGLASAVRLSVATSFEMHCPFNAAPANWKYRVTGFVRPLIDLKSLAAEREHLGHERKIVEAAVLVQGKQDLLAAPDFYPIADPEPEVWTKYAILH